MNNIDWGLLLNTIDYHAKQWYIKEHHEWTLCKRKDAFGLLIEMNISDPDKVMKQLYYRDREATAR